MHITFRKIRWANLLSSGNAFTEIDLEHQALTLMVGRNGAGKSTLLDALCFALYNKPFRDINKPQLVNSINNKGCLVEIEFAVGGHEYQVRRGLKPVLFEIIKDGKLIDQDAANIDYQKHLEDNILKIAYKAFTQVIILGATAFVPFMKLTAANRRDIIENLLGIEVFSSMNSILKEKITTNRSEIESNNFDRKLLEEKIKLQQANVKQQQTDKSQQIETILFEIKNLKTENVDIVAKMAEKDVLLEGRKDITNQLKVENGSIDNLRMVIRNLMADTKNLTNEVDFYKDNDNCPVCKQSIEESFKTETVAEKNVKIQKNVELYEAYNAQMSDYNAVVVDLQAKLTALNMIQKDRSDLSLTLGANNLQIHRLQTQVASYQEVSVKVVDNAVIAQLNADLQQVNDTLQQLSDRKRILELASPILKDNGIKAKIIKLYIPIINKLINKYLASLDFFVNFELDENFKETILSRHRDSFSYGSFSEGEKMRIDLALLFTWRAIAKMRSRTSANLLIMDELFDSSLDSDGIDGFTKILNELTAENNVIIISHQTDQIYDKFPNVLRFEKVKNFSKVSKNA